MKPKSTGEKSTIKYQKQRKTDGQVAPDSAIGRELSRKPSLRKPRSSSSHVADPPKAQKVTT